MGFVLIHPEDSVQVDINSGHKYAVRDICAGDRVIKYGFPIGIATRDIAAGELVHTHNIKTGLSGITAFSYTPVPDRTENREPSRIEAYVRQNGEIGIRNDIWIIPTVGCVNKSAERIAAQTGAFALTHPYGCSQLGEDHSLTQTILCGLIRHPNAGGVLVLGLGCENNNIPALQKKLGAYDAKRVLFLNAQDEEDEIQAGVQAVRTLQALAQNDKKQSVPVSKLKVGLKCGGSDALSGITANPLCGRITDRLVAMGGTAVLTEIPEIFGAEQLLLDRCCDAQTFRRAEQMINRCKDRFLAHGHPISENPSPGNKEGGISTNEEKSLGCVQKGGTVPVTAVLDYGETSARTGLHLLNGPGNDMVAVTNLTAAGCHLILFTTGRGTPLGAPVPTVKIASNTLLAQRKKQWIDFDAQTGSADELFDLLLQTASGKKTKNEENGYREIAVFKDGVTL